LIAFCLIGEGFYAVIVRAGDEPRLYVFFARMFLKLTLIKVITSLFLKSIKRPELKTIRIKNCQEFSEIVT